MKINRTRSFHNKQQILPCATLMKFVIRAKTTFQIMIRGVNNINIVQRIPREKFK